MPISGTPKIGGAQMEFVETCQPADGSVGSATLTASTAYLIRVRVARALTVSNIEIYVGGTSAGNVDAGIYSVDATYTTWTRMASAGSTAMGTANAIQTLALSGSVTLQPGVDYYLAFVTDSATAALLRNAGVGAVVCAHNRAVQKPSTFPLPASLTSVARSSGTVPWVLAY